MDPETSTYNTHASLDHRAPETVIPLLEDNTWNMDPRVNAAMLEVLKKDAVPSPDILFEEECSVDGGEQMGLSYGRNEFFKERQGYRLKLWDETKGIAVDVHLKPEKAVQRQAHDGVVKLGTKDEWMFYYFIP